MTKTSTDRDLHLRIVAAVLIAALAVVALVYGLVARSLDDPDIYPCLVERPCPDR
jgi:hypothetical protein